MIPGNIPLFFRTRGFSIKNSVRFNSADSAYLTRTPGGAGDRQKFTVSFWFKNGVLPSTSARQVIASANSANPYFRIELSDNAPSGRLFVYQYNGASYDFELYTKQLFRDAGAWYHVVVAFDTTQATAANRIKIYVNGVQVTAFDTANYPSVNLNTYWNAANAMRVGRGFGTDYFDGYLSQFINVDGSQLTPSSFGKLDSNGVWQPKAYSGTYGTNGFFLKFENSAAFGTDSSGNGNTFTASGLATNDQVTDTPTNVYATWNALSAGSFVTLSDGNLRSTGNSASNNGNTVATIRLPSTGKYHVQHTVAAVVSGYPRIGCVNVASLMGNGGTGLGGTSSYGGATVDASGAKDLNGSTTASWSATWSANDVIDFYYDMDNGAVYVAKNNSVQNSGNPNSGATRTGALYTFTPGSVVIAPAIADYNGSATDTNFGQQAFTYTTYSSYVGLCTSNLPAPAIKDGSAHFQTTLYTGTGSSLEVNQSGNSTFQPGLVWNKSRTQTHDHYLWDVLRGATYWLRSNTTEAQTALAQGLTSFDSDGFTMGTNAAVNQSTITFAAWQWKAGGAGVSNTNGSITSTVSANPTAGFSIVTYTGTGSNATVGHGLSTAPKLIIVKKRSGSDDWAVYHASVGATKYLRVDTTDAATTSSLRWNDTAPTSSVFSVGTGTATNGSTSTYVAYCFAEVDDYCKIGSYTGNASADGPFAYCGFKPAFVMWKNASTTGDWYIKDTARDTYNVAINRIYPNAAYAEDPNSTNDLIDIVSNGFKIRSSANAATNGSGNTIIFIAFAQHPFGGSKTTPVVAR